MSGWIVPRNRAMLSRPLVAMLLLSAGLHAAVIVFVRTHRFSVPGRPGPAIEARLVAASPAARAPAPALHEARRTRPLRRSPKRPVPAKAKPVMTASVAPKTVPVAEARPVPAAMPPQPTAVAGAGEPKQVPARPRPAEPAGGWYGPGQVDVPPKAREPIRPVYPAEARRRDLEGLVKLRLKIDETGAVRHVEVVESRPPGVFDQSALAALKGVHFSPARKDGVPVRAAVEVRLRYQLQGGW